MIDTEVDVEMTGGLTVSGTPTYAAGFLGNTNLAGVPDSWTYSDGMIDVGTLEYNEGGPYFVTLPVTVSSSAVVNEQCLTATITGNPPPGTGPLDDDVSDNVAKVCLVESDQKVLLRSGQANLLALYPCVGVTTHPCDSSDSVVLAIDGGKAALNEGYAPGTFQPENVIVQVGDPAGRSGINWRTGNDVDYTPAGAGILPGVVGELTVPIGTDGYTQHTFAIDDSDYGSNPGEIELLLSNGNFTVLNTDSQLAFGPLDLTISPYHIQFEFDKLGTYQADITLGATETSVAYTSKKTYTFHIGPIADLAVKDGGASTHVAADRNALTVVAVNNGPDELPGGATVTGLPTDADVLQISHGSYDDTAGTWNIGELRFRDYSLSRGEPEPTLVLSASAGDTDSVSITSSENYEVCIDGNGNDLHHDNQTDCEDVTDASWHTTAVYDTDTGNNTVTITATRGTGGGTDAPTLESPTAHMPAVGLAWDELEYLYGLPVKHYEAEWSSNERSWKELDDETPATETVDPNIEAGETRYYRVRAVNEAGVSGPWSASISAMIEEEIMATAGAPGKPVISAAPKEPNRREEILVSWSKPVENGSPIISYTLEVSDTGRDNSWSASGATLDGNALSWTHTGLTGGTRKFYRLIATNLCDADDPVLECHSLWSDAVSATTDPPGQSGPPTNVDAVPDGDAAIDVTWDAPLDDGGTPITRYEVQWSADGVSGWQNAGATSDGDTLTFKNTGMTFGTTRYYRVAARNSRGLSEWSAAPHASATTLAGVPGQPNLTATAPDSSTIDLTWTVPANNGSSIIRYELEWSPDGSTGSWTSLTSPSAAETSYSDGFLEPGTERFYRIRAVNGASPGEGSWSVERSAKTPAAVPGAPTLLLAQANGDNAIDLTWEPPFDDGGADISGYEIHVSPDGSQGSFSRLASPAATDRSYTHSGLQPGDERYYQLRARNSAGWGEFSQTAMAVTLTGVPTAPGLTARSNGATEIKLTWTPSDGSGSDIQGYQLEESDDGSDWNALASGISASDSEYVHTGLSGGTTKHYRIRAFNGNGDGQWSATRSATTDAGGPDAPALTLTVISDNQIDLSWTVLADNGSSIRGYLVERSADGSEPWERLTGNTQATTYSDDDLYRGMTRHYRVAAFNGAGTGPYSDTQSATTTGNPATEPGPPTLLRLSEVSRNQVTVAWDPPADDGGAPVSGYEYKVAPPCEDDPNTTENESESNCGFIDEDITSTTGTSARISGLNTDGDYYFRVRALNPVGTGEWAASINATLRPSTGALVSVSPNTITVNEGATVTHTIRLSTTPPHPVQTWVQPRSDGEYSDLEEAAHAYTGSLLIPSGWTHPDPDEALRWSEGAYAWSQGVRVTFTAPEDSDTDDEVALIDHFVFPLPYNHYTPCPQNDQVEREQCEQDWEDAWADSPYRQLTGASVKVVVNDND